MSKKNFKNIESLKPVVNVVNEAGVAINDRARTIKTSAVPEILIGALGAGAGGTLSFVALSTLGVAGLSAAGITSGLAAVGSIIGGGMVAGVFVLAAPIAGLASIGVGVTSAIKSKQLKQEKERLYQEALKKRNSIIEALGKETNADKDRIEYLTSLNNALQFAIKDLKSDLGYA